MEAKELRIGNFIKRRSKDETLIVDIQLLTSVSRSPVFFNPIPLTEEWYEKSNLHYHLGSENGCYLSKTPDDDIWIFGIIDRVKNAVALTVRVKYIHKVQNVYFELFDKELEFKNL